MDEFSFIDLIKQKSYYQKTLIKGIGDDAAIFRQANQDIVTAVDTFVEDVHFTKKTMTPFYVGYKGLAANISDLAAMGASPVFYLVSIIIPKSWSKGELELVYSGMKAIAEDYQMDLIGGDTVSGDKLALSITIIGYVEKEKARFRNQAKDGDIVFVTGSLGDSQAGLHILLNEGEYTDQNYYIKRHQKPTPRVDFSLGLKDISRVSLNDISDGIANEANEIAEASNVNIILDKENIPFSESFYQFPLSLQEKWKYFGGEDFELLGTVAKEDFEHVQRIADKTNTRITEIGYTEYSKSLDYKVYLEENHKRLVLSKHGYTHLK